MGMRELQQLVTKDQNEFHILIGKIYNNLNVHL
jgi:hypothetical protein